MKYLGDSLVAARYYKNSKLLFINPGGDPTFLHPDFSYQPLLNLLQNHNGEIVTMGFSKGLKSFANGWNYEDYNYSYMTERSKFPIMGNNFWISKNSLYQKTNYSQLSLDSQIKISNLSYFISPSIFSKKIIINTEQFDKVAISRNFSENEFNIDEDSAGGKPLSFNTIPFRTRHGVTASEILESILKKRVSNGEACSPTNKDTILHSQPSDSLFKPMMHHSDNFFAEQTLLMASNEHLGFMNDEKIIDTILKSDLKDVPQRPKWVDGSGLSRYNLFTPKSFVYILNKMKNEFGLERMKNILPTGGEGTLSSYYKKDAGFIYAKTGTLSNNCALSGYLITNKGKLLIFSVLANNYITGATPVRKAVEQFLQQVREKY